VLSGWAAWSRGDYDLMLVRYAPDCQVEPYRAMVGVGGMRTSYDGHAGLRELAADLREAWERIELIPQEIVDAGNPVVILGDVRLRARGSGVEFESPIGSVLWSERGMATLERDFGDWDEALRAAGIPTSPKVAGTKAGTKLSGSQRPSETLTPHESTEPDLSA
jgi:ketosteroid isomerase-like protein